MTIRIPPSSMRLAACAGAVIAACAYTRLVARTYDRPGGSYGDWFPWTLDLCDLDAEAPKCEPVTFDAAPAGAAGNITAWDVSCDTARLVAAAAGPIAIKPGELVHYRYKALDFVCNGSHSSTPKGRR